MELPKELKNEIWDYCRANDIMDIDEFITGLVKTAFTIEKYGYAPNSGQQPKIVEKEVVKEIIKEVPVEKIVEKVIEKEVPVEKIVKVTDDEGILKLKSEMENTRLKEMEEYNNQLMELAKERDELKTKVEEMTQTIADKDEQIDKMSKTKEDGTDIYGERTIGRLGSNLLD